MFQISMCTLYVVTSTLFFLPAFTLSELVECTFYIFYLSIVSKQGPTGGSLQRSAASQSPRLEDPSLCQVYIARHNGNQTAQVCKSVHDFLLNIFSAEKFQTKSFQEGSQPIHGTEQNCSSISPSITLQNLLRVRIWCQHLLRSNWHFWQLKDSYVYGLFIVNRLFD